MVVVTDMFGSTPSNLAMGACRRPPNRRVLYGANLPLLVKLAKARHMPIDDAVASALTAGPQIHQFHRRVRPERDADRPLTPSGTRDGMRFSLDIVNEKGLHARASAKFVETVERFDARAQVSRDGMEVSGDSIMGLMMLAAARGTSIDVASRAPKRRRSPRRCAPWSPSRFGEPT